jgi:hypothetical protein
VGPEQLLRLTHEPLICESVTVCNLVPQTAGMMELAHAWRVRQPDTADALAARETLEGRHNLHQERLIRPILDI